jgi:hypothetical protein
VRFLDWRRWLWPVAGLAVSLAWAAGATQGHARGRAAAAAAAALVTASVVPATLESLLAGVALLGVLPLAMVRPPLLAAVVVVVAVADRADRPTAQRLVSGAGAVLLAAGMAVTAIDGQGWRLVPSGRPAAALVLAGALAVLAGRSQLLLVPALLAAAAAVPVLPHPEATIAAVLAAVALAAFDRPGPAVAALGLAAAPLPAAFLLMAAGALCTVVPLPLALLGALPGAAALVGTLAVGRLSASAVALSAGLAVVTGILAWRVGEARPAPWTEDDAHPRRLPAAVLLFWLAVAPDTWRWAGRAPLTPYQRGAALALAAGVLSVLAAAAFEVVRRHRAPVA